MKKIILNLLLIIITLFLVSCKKSNDPNRRRHKEKNTVEEVNFVGSDGWIIAEKKSPPISQPVLISLSSGSTMIAYLNDKGEWKLEMKRTDANGGEALPDVIKWREY